MIIVLLDRLNADNLEQVWRSARCSKNERLFQACSEFVVENLQKLPSSGFVAKMKDKDFKRVLKLAISEGMEETAALTKLVEWIKASPERQTAFARLIPTIDCSVLPVDFVASFYGEQYDLFSSAANRYVNINSFFWQSYHGDRNVILFT